MVSLAVDVFWSFRSPYSYLALPRLAEIERLYEVRLTPRPVYPIAVRIPGFFQRVNPLWPPYLFRDTMRIAEMLDIPYAWPDPDPVVQDRGTGEVAKEQPYIHRLTRLGIAAVEAGRGTPFLLEVSRLIWSGTIRKWHEGTHLAEATARAGLDLAELDRAITADPEHYEAAIRKNEAAQTDGGHWGVPLMVFEGEPFFGQDRIEHLLWRMRQRGLKARPA